MLNPHDNSRLSLSVGNNTINDQDITRYICNPVPPKGRNKVERFSVVYENLHTPEFTPGILVGFVY